MPGLQFCIFLGECFFYRIPFFIVDLSGYNFMIITLLFVVLLKWVYDNLRIYKDVTQILLVIFKDSHISVCKELVWLFLS